MAHGLGGGNIRLVLLRVWLFIYVPQLLEGHLGDRKPTRFLPDEYCKKAFSILSKLFPIKGVYKIDFCPFEDFQ